MHDGGDLSSKKVIDPKVAHLYPGAASIGMKSSCFFSFKLYAFCRVSMFMRSRQYQLLLYTRINL